ncbi:MAG TPA: porin family protein [Chryseosolibacter sp.]|nr:porin family protein [Chryseosolibacter sp.]
MNKLYTLVILLLVLSVNIVDVSGQTGSALTGTQTLRLARASYDQGRLHELPSYLLVDTTQRLKPIFNFTESIEAHKLLILTYIYIEEPEKADRWMIDLLKTDHFFEITDSDPVEFKTLYKKFRTRPLYRFGVKGGISQTFVSPIKTYYQADASARKGEYTPNLGFQFGFVVERDLGSKLWTDKNSLLERLTVMGELYYTIQSFNYVNPSLFDSDFEERESSITHRINNSRIQLNALGQYKFAKYGKNKTPYVALGPSVSYLMGADFEPLSLVESRDEFAEPTDISDSFKKIDLGVILAAGGRFKLGGIYFIADIRYQYGLMNVATGKNRYQEQGLTQSFYTVSDFSMNQIMVNIGLLYPYFSPRKMIK